MSLNEALLNPELSEAFVLFLLTIFSLTLYAGIRLYSTLVIASWGIMVVIFINVVMYNMSIIYFYFAIITTVMLAVIASMRYSSVQSA